MENIFSVRLHDGRNLSFAEYGARNGAPVLFCHGAPGSRWQISPGMAKQAEANGIRVIVPERPGYGLSDNQPGRTLLDWPQDVSALMDDLGIERFGVAGYSMGSVYALACGHALPDRVANIKLVAGVAPNMFHPEVMARMAPTVRDTVVTARDNPEALVQFLGSLRNAPDQFLALHTPSLPPPDQAVLANPEAEKGFLLDCEAALCQGGAGMVHDFTLASREWGFALGDIHAPALLWHGTEDVNAPVAMAEYLAQALPHARLHRMPGAGHLCLASCWPLII